MRIESNRYYDYQEKLKYERWYYKNKGWLMGISYLNHNRGYEKDGRLLRAEGHSRINDCFPVSEYDNRFQVGEEIYIDDNDENVFVDPAYPNVAHIITACKNADNIYTKVISLGIFTHSYIEIVNEKDVSGNYKKDEHGNYIRKHYSDKKEYEDILKIISPQDSEYKIKQYIEKIDFNTEPKFVYPFTNQVHDVYDAIRPTKTNLEIWNIIKGKCLKVVSTKEVCTLSVTQMTSLSSTVLGKVHTRYEYWPLVVNVPVFTFINKDINKEIKEEHHYEPRYFIREEGHNYRIVVDKKTGKQGISNLDTGKVICRSIFDNISLFDFQREDNKPPVKMLKFNKDGYMATCELCQLETMMKKIKKKND